jgi:hypothetical protein
MRFIGDERGQIEDIFTLAIKIALVMLFLGTIAYSYDEYSDRKEPMERFSAGLDYANILKNHIMCVRVGGVPNPGLIAEADFDNFRFDQIRPYWTNPYYFEVVIRDASGTILYEEGVLNKSAGPPEQQLEPLDELSVAYSVIAVNGRDGVNRAARMEVWVWS